MRKSTMIHLVAELEKLPLTPEIKVLIDEAKAGEYHDYKNQKYDCGKIECYKKLVMCGQLELAQRVRDGEFDEEADEDDKEMLKKDILSMGFTEEQAKTMFGV